MSSSPPPSSAHTPLTRDELAPALKVALYDGTGATKTLGELIQGKRSVLIFIRHFWCLNCQVYLRHMSSLIPPSKLPPNTQILIIGCGSHQPIATYTSQSACVYPIYTDPSLQLHSLFGFKYNLAEAKAGDVQRDYMRDAGSAWNRIWGGVWAALGHLEHVGATGPKSLNGGEVVVSADGECEYIYRMQNTVDHTDIKTMAELIGVEGGVEIGDVPTMQACGDACEVGKEKV